MSRHGRRGTRGEPDEEAWLPPGDDREEQPWEGTAPPWEQPGWDDGPRSRRGAGPGDLAGGHPSGPLTGGHPSGPLPPLPPQRDWREDSSIFTAYPDTDAGPGYPAGGRHPGDHPRPGYPDADYDRAGYDRGYSGAGYDGSDYHDDDTGLTGTGYPEDDTGYHQADAGYGDTGTGYAVPGAGYPDAGTGYQAAYPFAGVNGEGEYPAPDEEYPDYQGRAGRRRREHDGGRGYADRGGWYGDDVDDQPAWAEEAEDDYDGFLPGLSADAAARRAGGRGGGQRPPRGGQGKKRRRGMRRAAPLIALSVILLILGGVGGVGYHYYRTYFHPPDFTGPGTGSVVVQIQPGDTATAVGQRLQQMGVVASARAFSNAAKANPRGNALEPGYFRVHKHMQASLALALLLQPSSRVQTRITIPEGKRLSQIIALLGQATGNPGGYQKAIKDVAALQLPSFAHSNPEGYLFPATYDVQPNTPPIKVLQDMVTRFGQEAATVHLPAAAAHAEMSQADVITVASLIQAEGRHLSDFPKIAEVIYDRLNSNPSIKLQLDSTVMYALHSYGIRASASQTKVNSPYNTYLHVGLPPGPIDCPGDAAIKAALHPDHGHLLYFVTVDPKTGVTKFTSSFAQFGVWEAELTQNLAKGR